MPARANGRRARSGFGSRKAPPPPPRRIRRPRVGGARLRGLGVQLGVVCQRPAPAISAEGRARVGNNCRKSSGRGNPAGCHRDAHFGPYSLFDLVHCRSYRTPAHPVWLGRGWRAHRIGECSERLAISVVRLGGSTVSAHHFHRAHHPGVAPKFNHRLHAVASTSVATKLVFAIVAVVCVGGVGVGVALGMGVGVLPRLGCRCLWWTRRRRRGFRVHRMCRRWRKRWQQCLCRHRCRHLCSCRHLSQWHCRRGSVRHGVGQTPPPAIWAAMRSLVARRDWFGDGCSRPPLLLGLRSGLVEPSRARHSPKLIAVQMARRSARVLNEGSRIAILAARRTGKGRVEVAHSFSWARPPADRRRRCACIDPRAGFRLWRACGLAVNLGRVSRAATPERR